MEAQTLFEVVNTLATWTEAIVGAVTLLLYKVILPILGLLYALTKLTPSTADDTFVKRWLDKFRKTKTTLVD